MGTVDLFLSRLGRRGLFERIAAELPASGSYLWPVSGPVSDSVAFKVVARDAADNVAWVVSDSLSRISDVAAVHDNGVPPPPRVVVRSVRPNPVHDRIRVEFSLPAPGDVVVSLHDVSGRRLAVLAKDHRQAGLSVIEAAMPLLARAIRPGVLFLRLSTEHDAAITRITVLR